MLTCKSPRKVLRVAHYFAARSLPKYSCRFSRHDFTLPQLFACLVLREHQRKSYRGIEALLQDCPCWRRDIGMSKTPDHNTLCRAFHFLIDGRRVTRLLDHLTQWMALQKLLGDTLAVDSTLMDVHYRSRHYEQRCRHYANRDNHAADSRRSRSARRTPKLSLGVDVRSHFVLCAKPRTGMGSDAPDLIPLLCQAKARNRRLRRVLADSGYDSHDNHRVCREELGIRSLIKANTGRPTSKPPLSKYRRRMKRELAGSQAGQPYGQRAQAESANSMVKRNFGDHLRARSNKARRNEQLLRVLTHNIMIVRR